MASERTPLESKVISCAFEKDVDLDRAAVLVLREELRKTEEGLYERLFGKKERNR